MSSPRRRRFTPWSSSPCPALGRRATTLLLAGLIGSAAAVAQPAAADGLRWSAGGGLASGTVLGAWSTRFGWADAPADPALANPVTARLSWQWLNDYRFGTGGGLRATGGLLGGLDRGSNGAANSANFASTPGANSGSPSTGSTLRLSGGTRPVWASSANSTFGDNLWATPYVGLGYDTATTPRSGWGGWGLSADVGWVTRRTGGRGLGLGAQTDGEDSWRSLRVAPMLQVGVSYAF